MMASLILAALVFTQLDASKSYDVARELVSRHSPRDAGTLRGRVAALKIFELAAKEGAMPRIQSFKDNTPYGEKHFFNVYADILCDKKSRDWVVVVSHFDTKSSVDCPGANDGASTSGLLMGLVRALKSSPLKNVNIRLMWLDGEESMIKYGKNDGLWGSRHAAKELKKSKKNVLAVICLDMLGDRNLDIKIPENTDSELSELALKAARLAGYKDVVGKADFAVTDDHVPFLQRGYKTLNLIDFNYGSKPKLNDYWHTPKDDMSHISLKSIYSSGRIVSELLNLIDSGAMAHTN